MFRIYDKSRLSSEIILKRMCAKLRTLPVICSHSEANVRKITDTISFSDWFPKLSSFKRCHKGLLGDTGSGLTPLSGRLLFSSILAQRTENFHFYNGILKNIEKCSAISIAEEN